MVQVKMGISKMSPTKKIEFMRFCVTSVTGNANFTSPLPSASTMATMANNTEAALMVAKGGGKDDKANLKVKIAALELMMRQYAAYVENIANANPASAEAVILSAGLEVKRIGSRYARAFDARLTGNPGEVRAFIKAVSRAAYEFQICTDLSNEANWVTFYIGTLSRVVKRDLAPNTRYYFRARVIDKNGYQAWSDVRSVFVME
ncbi:MAG: fibronectin type III domain-containing protein [Bacteroidetes bacterium]|nr:fibronectin type III domain-containing protein [Bacteroidota bacterium]